MAVNLNYTYYKLCEKTYIRHYVKLTLGTCWKMVRHWWGIGLLIREMLGLGVLGLHRQPDWSLISVR